MIIFYEGLPRSGKSLSSLKEYLVPMLAKGRKVFAYIEGLNHEQIAKLANIDIETCQSLLIQLKREQVKDWYKHVENDSFVILDEIQNFYPNQRKPLTEEQTQAITEHGHKGLDILLMGQVFTDVHKTWTGRCAQRVMFVKRESVGKPNEFMQTVFKPVALGDKIKWQALPNKKSQPYDDSYFGAYKSHTDDTDNTETLIDDRANVWNSPIMRKWLPLFGGAVLLSIGFLFYMFLGGGLEKSITNQPEPQKIVKSENLTLSQLQQNINSTEPVKPIQPVSSVSNLPHQAIQNVTTSQTEQTDTVQDYNKDGKIRLSGFIRMGNKQTGFIEWIGADKKINQRLTFQQLKVLGYVVLVDEDGTIAMVSNGLNKYVATAFPLNDSDGSITEHRISNIESMPLATSDSQTPDVSLEPQIF